MLFRRVFVFCISQVSAILWNPYHIGILYACLSSVKVGIYLCFPETVMTDKAKQLVSLYVQGIVQDSMPQFEDILMNNLTSEMSKDQVYVKMLLNAVTLSTDLATQIILDLLDSTDVLPITSDEKVLQKLALRLHTDNLKK